MQLFYCYAFSAVLRRLNWILFCKLANYYFYIIFAFLFFLHRPGPVPSSERTGESLRIKIDLVPLFSDPKLRSRVHSRSIIVAPIKIFSLQDEEIQHKKATQKNQQRKKILNDVIICWLAFDQPPRSAGPRAMTNDRFHWELTSDITPRVVDVGSQRGWIARSFFFKFFRHDTDDDVCSHGAAARHTQINSSGSSSNCKQIKSDKRKKIKIYCTFFLLWAHSFGPSCCVPSVVSSFFRVCFSLVFLGLSPDIA